MSSGATQNMEDMMNELDWVQIRQDIRSYEQEPFLDRLLRKCMENPLVPLGTLTTVGALSYGLRSLYRGDSQMSQYMMRTRVGAQAVTIAAVVGGSLLTAQK